MNTKRLFPSIPKQTLPPWDPCPVGTLRRFHLSRMRYHALRWRAIHVWAEAFGRNPGEAALMAIVMAKDHRAKANKAGDAGKSDAATLARLAAMERTLGPCQA